MYDLSWLFFYGVVEVRWRCRAVCTYVVIGSRVVEGERGQIRIVVFFRKWGLLSERRGSRQHSRASVKCQPTAP